MQQQDDFYVGYDSENQKEKPLPAKFKKELEPKSNPEAAGPEFREVILIEIPIPGGDVSVVPVEEKHKRIYAKQWELFCKQEEQTVGGTPLTEWSVLDSQMAYALMSRNIFTVEQLAEVSDGLLQEIGMGGRQKREEAKRFVARSALKEDTTAKEALEKRLAELEALALAQNEMIRELSNDKENVSGSKKGKKADA
jgi:hypothetical protein